jgi:DNA-binding GntR family transcriptional regulator
MSVGVIVKRTTVDDVADRIRTEIINGNIAAGGVISQDLLAKQLGISRIPVREALTRLTAEGFVRSLAHYSPIAAPLTISDGIEIFELRAILEERLLVALMEKKEEINLSAARELLSAFQGSDHLSPFQWCELNQHFHDAIYQESGQTRTLTMLRSLFGHSARYIIMQMQIHGRSDRAYEQHEALLDLIEKRDRKGAAKLLREHILNIIPDLKSLDLPMA